MSLHIDGDTFLTAQEAADELNLGPQTFRNYRSLHGDKFVKGHTDLINGRVFFRLDDVRRAATERASR